MCLCFYLSLFLVFGRDSLEEMTMVAISTFKKSEWRVSVTFFLAVLNLERFFGIAPKMSPKERNRLFGR